MDIIACVQGTAGYKDRRRRAWLISSTFSAITLVLTMSYSTSAPIAADCTAFVEPIVQKVVAFEPNPENIAKLRDRFGNHPKITLCDVAIADKEGTASFYLDTRPGMAGVASSLLKLDGMEAVPAITVRVTTIDCFVAETNIVPNFIKLDIEGNEPAALSGACHTIRTHRPKLLFEFWETHWERFKPVFEWLIAERYDLTRISDGQDAYRFYCKEAAMGQDDILALPRLP